MGSDGHLCGWQLPRLEANEPVQQRRKAKLQRSVMDPPPKYNTLPAQGQAFQHFSDASMYMDDYRKKNTVENTGKERTRFPKTEDTKDAKLSKYIDIRMPEKKVCLTGLPHLKKVTRTRTVQKRFLSTAFISEVPHLPRLTLNGISKTVTERELNRTDEKQRNKNANGKKRKRRLPFIKPAVNIRDRGRIDSERNCSDFFVP